MYLFICIPTYFKLANPVTIIIYIRLVRLSPRINIIFCYYITVNLKFNMTVHNTSIGVYSNIILLVLENG